MAWINHNIRHFLSRQQSRGQELVSKYKTKSDLFEHKDITRERLQFFLLTFYISILYFYKLFRVYNCILSDATRFIHSLRYENFPFLQNRVVNPKRELLFCHRRTSLTRPSYLIDTGTKICG